MARQRIVIALGGNALLKRGEALTAANQRANVRAAARAIAPITDGNDIVISHGNGPQVGLLALQAAQNDTGTPLDVLGAESEGMIGYMIEQELGNQIPFERPIATTMLVLGLIMFLFAIKPLLFKGKDWRSTVGLENE